MARSRKKSRKVRFSWLLLLVVIAIVAVRYVERVGPDKKPSDRFTVIRAIDGDTVELLGGDKLRLLAIDTPEKGETYYDEATQYLATLAVGKPARIEYANSRRDRYGRLLGYLYIDDTLFVNRAILDSGLGYLYLFGDNDMRRSEVKILLEAQRHAMGKKSALWAIEHEPEEYYVANENSFRLHRPGCASLENVRPDRMHIYRTREEGLAEGLSPCRNCKP